MWDIVSHVSISFHEYSPEGFEIRGTALEEKAPSHANGTELHF
jgi:hypothetical protein